MLVILVISVVLFSFGGCENSPSPGIVAKQYANTILDCLKSNEEPDKLKSLFCKESAESHDLDAEIAEAMEFIDGNIISDGKWHGMEQAGSFVSDGIMIDSHICPCLFG